MSFLRRSTQSITASIRQITTSQPAKETALRSAAIGALPHLIASQVQQNVSQTKKQDAGRSLVKHISLMKKVNPQAILPTQQFSSFNLSGSKCVLASNTARVAKLFASFDLSSISISFAGMMGDFAVWAITDLSTGELMYLIDDNT